MADALASVLDPNHPQITQYRTQSPELLALAESLDITSDAGLLEAAEHTKAATSACRAIKALFKPAKDALNEAKRQISGLEDGLLSGFERADDILRRKVTLYRAEQNRRAVEERQRREAEERQRREDEQIAQAARLETMARKTGEAHYERAAEFVLDQPVRVMVATEKPVTPKGLSFRTEIGIHVQDVNALIAAVAAGYVSTDALLPNLPWLRTEAKQRADALTGGDEVFPGVLITKTTDVTVRTR
jgi:hypothetical protein